MALDYIVYPGQYCRINIDGTHKFTGIIEQVDKRLASEAGEMVFMEVQVGPLNNIPARRTVRIGEDEGDTTKSIVEYMVDIMIDEGFEYGTINTGITLADDWIDDVISIADVLDECASRSGYQWFIDKDYKLHFLQEITVVDAAWDLVDGEAFEDYRDVSLSESLVNYHNRIFLLGGNDDHGDQVYIYQINETAQQAMQDITAGSGVHGFVHRDTALVEHEYYDAIAGTDDNTIVVGVANPDFAEGDCVWNVTRNARALIDTVDSTTQVQLGSDISGQVSTDVIEVYNEANAVARNLLKKASVLPASLEFTTFNIDFEPQTKLKVELAKLGIAESYWLIEEISMQDVGAGYYKSRIKATRRDNSNFSTQKSPVASDYFRGF